MGERLIPGWRDCALGGQQQTASLFLANHTLTALSPILPQGVGKAGRQGLRLMDWSCGQTEDWTDSKWELGEEPPVTLPSVAGDGCWKGRDRGPIMLPP